MSERWLEARGRRAAILLFAATFPACEALCNIETDRRFDPADDATSATATSTGQVTSAISTSAGATSTSGASGSAAATSTAGGDGGVSSASQAQSSGGDGGDGGASSHSSASQTQSSSGMGGDGGASGGGMGGLGGDGGGATTGGGEGGGTSCPNVGPATDGPYGEAQLHFGTPVLEPSLPPENLDNSQIGYRNVSVSPDGLYLADQSSTNDFVIRRRDDALSPWDGGLDHIAVWVLEPHLVSSALGMFGCNGGLRRCGYQERATTASNFNGIESTGEATFIDGPFADAAGGLGFDRGFTPTPDGRFVAFSSSRTIASPDENDGVDDFRASQLWIAEALDPTDPSLGYDSLDPIAAAWAPYVAPPTCPPFWPEEGPEWIADDGRTIVFHSGRAGRFDLYVTSGDPETGEFDEPLRVLALSTSARFEESFSMPSLATLAITCGRGYAYFRRFEFGADCSSQSELYRVPVCVGEPCD